jgi:hypothetical protein
VSENRGPSEPRTDDFYLGLPQQTLDAYRAIGRYFVTFSDLIGLMLSAVLTEITWEDELRRELLHMTLGQLGAQETVDAFFAIGRRVADPKLDHDDREIERVLRDQVNQTIRRRNVIAHGDWSVDDLPDVSSAPLDDPSEHGSILGRVRASSISQPFHHEILSAVDIDAEIEEMRGLEMMLVRFCGVCMMHAARLDSPHPPGTRLRDHFRVLGSANARYVDLRPPEV